MKKKISLVLCAVLVLALAIVPMFALTASADDTGTWTLVTDVADLTVGDTVIIVAKGYDKALSTNQKSNNRGETAITKDAANGTVTITADVQQFTLEAGTTDGTYAFNTGSGYIYAASSKSNYLRTQTTNDANSSWKITISSDGTASVIASGANTRNVMQYNQSSSLFACYSSASQKAICIYKLTAGTDCAHTNRTTEVVEPTCNEVGMTYNVCADCGKDKIPVEGSEVPALGHSGCEEDYLCDVCGKVGANDWELSIPEADALAQVAGSSYTADQYYVTGKIVSIVNTQYGNLTIEDENGDSLYLYGLYSADASVRYDGMDVKPGIGDTIKVYTVLGTYSGSSQGKNACLIEHTVAECDHVDADGDYVCDNGCGNGVEPEADQALTLEQATALGEALNGAYTTGKFYVTGVITEVANDQYGNVYIEDAEGNTFYIYGLYNYDGSVAYDALEYAPQVNDEITVWGVIGSYNGAAQMKYGWINEVVVHEHVWGEGVVTDATCTEAGNITYTCDGCGETKVEEIAATGHDINSFTVHTFCEVEGYITCSCRDCEAVFDSRVDEEAQAYLEELNNMPYVTIDLSAQGHKLGADGKCSACEAELVKFAGAQVNVGSDLGVKWYVNVAEGVELGEYVFTIDFLGETVEVAGEYADGKIMFFFENIAPQNMGDVMTAKFVMGNVELTKEYSVKENLVNIAKEEGATDELKTLVADLLNYGAASQKYMGHTGELVNADLAELGFVASTGDITATDYELVGNDKESGTYFKSVNVLFGNINRIVVKVVVKESATLVVGDKTYNLTAGTHEIYSKDLTALELAEDVVFQLGGATFTCNVLDYATAKANDETVMGELAAALYYYAQSAAAYNA